MDIKKACPIRADRRLGFVVVCNEMKRDEHWYHIKDLRKLIKFIKNIQKRHKEFTIYRCSSGKKMDDDMIERIKNVGKIEKERLYLDDNKGFKNK